MTKIGEKTGTVKWESKIRALKDGKVHMGMAVDALLTRNGQQSWYRPSRSELTFLASRALRRQSRILNGKNIEKRFNPSWNQQKIF